jgi:hypothetical protein
MTKAIIVSVLVGGILTNLAPNYIPRATAQTPTKIQHSATPNNSPQLQLLDPGAQPRRELKFTPSRQTKQTLTIQMGMNMEMSMDGQAISTPNKLPKTLMKLDLIVTAVDPNGDIHYDFSYTEARVIPDPQIPKELISAMEKSLKTLIGIKGTVITSNRGQIIRQNLVLPQNMEPNMKQFLSQLNRSLDRISTPLPLEAVGTGAKWSTNLPLDLAGMKINQKTDYEVIALDGSGATIKTKVTQTAPPQNLRLPGTPKTAKIRLNSISSQGEGKVVLQFNSLLPIQGQTSISTRTDMSAQERENEKMINIQNKTSIDLNMSSGGINLNLTN